MATWTHPESRRSYSWWWDSHISPKNSKWLQENLTDMDMKVKSMIKLLEEDADSFARRAEMYYKKRPELMKLVEEFYRAYRALAERYDQATGALRQAHRTMAEAFPNQVPFALNDDSPSGSSTAEGEPRTPEMPPPIRALVEPDDLQKDALGQSSPFLAFKRNGAYSDENDALNSKRGLKQLNDMFASGEATSQTKFAEGKVRKGLSFHEEGKISEQKTHNGSIDIEKNEKGERDAIYEKTRILQNEVSQISSENQNLKMQIKSELERVVKSENEILRLQESLSKSEADKEVSLIQCQKYLEKISNLEMEISDNRNLKSEMMIKTARLENAEKQCLLLEKEKQALEMEVQALSQQTKEQQQELHRKQEELEKLKCCLQEEHNQYIEAEVTLQSLEKLHSQSLEKLRVTELEFQSGVEKLKNVELRNCSLEEDIRQVKEALKNMELRNCSLEEHIQQVEEASNNLNIELKLKEEELKKLNISIEDEHLLSVHAEEALRSMEKLHSQSQEEVRVLMLDVQSKLEKLKGVEFEKQHLEEEVRQLTERNGNLNGQVRSSALTIKNLQEEILSLKETQVKLENEVEHHVHGNKTLQQEIQQLNEKNENLNGQVLSSALTIKNLQEEILSLKETQVKFENEVEHNIQWNKDLQQELQHLNEENRNLDGEVLSSAFTIKNLQGEILSLKEMQLKLENEVEHHVQGNKNLQQEVQQLNETNGNLNGEVLSSASTIKYLQEEILSLEETLVKLKSELEHHIHGEKTLQEELHSLREEIADLDMRYQFVMKQIEAVGLNKESLQVSVKELQDASLELKDLCKQHEDEKAILLSKLENMDEVTEKNTLLEISLSDATVELEGLREKVKSLEESCGSMNTRVSDLVSENGTLLYQLETIMQNIEKLSENNTFLENSLSDANAELGGLRGKLKSFEESSQSLYNENSSLQSEKNTLLAKVENIGITLENTKKKYSELEDKHLHLEQEKESTVTQVNELQNLLKVEQQEHEAYVISSNTQQATLAAQISTVQKESEDKDKKLEALQYKLLNWEIQAFILQKCLLDLKEWNRKHMVSSRCIERLLSDTEQENLEQKKMIKHISEHNKKLHERIQMVLKSSGINDARRSDGTEDETRCQHILGKIKEIQNFISDTLDENHALLLEKTIISTFLQQVGLDLAILNMDKHALNQDYKRVTQQLLVLNSEKRDLIRLNENLRQAIHAGNLREDNLKGEADILGKELLAFQGRHKKMQADIGILLEENLSLLNEVSNLRDGIQKLEEENCAIFAEAMNLGCLSLIFEQCNAERAMAMRICSSDLDSLRGVNTALENRVAGMVQKIELIELENILLKDSATKLEDCQGHLLMLQDDLNVARDVNEQLNHQIEQLCNRIETGNCLLIQKDLEITEANKKFEVTENENMNMHRNLEIIKMEFDEVVGVRKELEKKICVLIDDNSSKDNEIACIHESNQMLNAVIQMLRNELVELRASKEHLASELTFYEEEVTRLWIDTHFSTVHVEIFEEKLLELIGECESLEISAIVQRRILEEQIILNYTNADCLKQKFDSLKGESRTTKAKLDAYLPLVLSLQNNIASLEHQTLSLLKYHEPHGHPQQDISLVRLEPAETCQQLSADLSITEPDGILELRKLQARVGELQKVVIEYCEFLLQQSDVNAKSAAMEMEIKASKPERTSKEEEVQLNKSTTTQHEVDLQEPGKDRELQPSNAESSKGGYALIMKDIQLDQSSYDDRSGLYQKGGLDNAETDDQMLKLWETAEIDCNKEMLGASSITITDDIHCRQVEAVEKEKSEYPSSELVIEKELGVDRLQMPKRVFSHQDWKRRILERLASDTKRLSILQNSVQELKKQLEKSEKGDTSINMKYDTMKGQLKRAEEAISEQVDINNNLTKKAEDCSGSCDSSQVVELEEVGNRWKRQVSDNVQRGSEKIGRLELELQKIQYILLKLDEECENRSRAAHGRSRVILKDFLYGRRENYRRKRGHFCGCIRPKTSGD